jgi:hypothetical protein
MPAPPLANTLEGGTDTTTITPGNSGGASGDAFSNVVIGASATLTFSATQSRNALSMALVEPGTSALTYAEWTGLGSITANIWFRFYLFLVALPNVILLPLRFNTSGAVGDAFLRINTSGTVQYDNAAQLGEAGTLGTVVCKTGQWIRLEGRVKSSTTVGEAEWRLFNNADSTAYDDTKNATGLVLGANADACRIGSTVAAGPTSQTFYFDDLALSTVDWIGPSLARASMFNHLPLI